MAGVFYGSLSDSPKPCYTPTFVVSGGAGSRAAEKAQKEMWEDIQRAGRQREPEDEAVGAPETQRVVSSARFVREARSSGPVVRGDAPPSVSTEARAEDGPTSSPREAMATLPDGVPAARWYPEPDEGEAPPDSDGTPATTPSPVLPPKSYRR